MEKLLIENFDTYYRSRLEKLATTNISDAMDTFGIKGATHGVGPMYATKKIVGRAMTVKTTAAGLTKGERHLGTGAITEANTGDVIVLDNGGRVDVNGWGGILATACKLKGISGVVIDGACRDVDEFEELEFPVYAKATVVATARGRIIEESYNKMVQFQGVQVRPGDIVVADKSGVVFIPQEKLEEIVTKAEEIKQKEDAMIADLKAGMSLLEVDKKYSYEKMLDKK